MGVGVCPPQVSRAHEIENLINEKAGTQDLNDSDFDDSADEGANEPIEISSDKEEDGSPVPSPLPPAGPAPIKSAIAQSACNDVSRRTGRASSGPDLISKLSRVFDPDTQKARDTERANCSLQNTHFLAQSQQLRDLQQSNERLHQQLTDLQARLQEANRNCDQVELKLEMLQMPGMGMGRPVPQRSVQHRQRRTTGIPKKKHKCEETYPEGGGSTWWVTDEEDIASDESREYDGYYARKRDHILQQSPSPFRHPKSSREHNRNSASRFLRPSTPHPCTHTLTFRSPSPFCSAVSDRNNTYVHAPGLNLTKSDRPIARPSRSVMGPPASVEGTGVELTISPQRGPPVSFVISPIHP
jgi:hypothetical protein